jgi:hypothetical protein
MNGSADVPLRHMAYIRFPVLSMKRDCPGKLCVWRSRWLTSAWFFLQDSELQQLFVVITLTYMHVDQSWSPQARVFLNLCLANSQSYCRIELRYVQRRVLIARSPACELTRRLHQLFAKVYHNVHIRYCWSDFFPMEMEGIAWHLRDSTSRLI